MVKSAKAKSAKAAPQSRAFASADSSLRISAIEFRAWQGARSNNEVARLLYVGPNKVAAMRAEGAGPDIARACRAISAGIEPGDAMAHCEMLGRINAVIKAG